MDQPTMTGERPDTAPAPGHSGGRSADAGAPASARRPIVFRPVAAVVRTGPGPAAPAPQADAGGAPQADAGGARQADAEAALADRMRAAVADAAGTMAAVRGIRALLGAAHVSYIAARLGEAPHKDPYVRSTYPAAWIARYLFKEYWKIDPVLQEGFRRARPFDWRDLEPDHPRHAGFFADARAHGVGSNGLLVPLTNAHGQRAILSVTTESDGALFDAFRRQAMKPLMAAGDLLHARAVRAIHGDAPPPPRLSPREREVLAWIGEGKEVPAIAVITGLSEHTVRTYLKSARLKLDCGTKAQAAVKAERLALIASEAQ